MKRLINTIRILQIAWQMHRRLRGSYEDFERWAIYLNDQDWEVLTRVLTKTGRDGQFLLTDLEVRRRLVSL